MTFERRVTAARAALAAGELARGAALLAEAAAMWRGPALADAADAPFAAGPIARLEELRVTAAEELFEARLALGEGAALVPGIEELVAAHPLRERLRGQLMRAMYTAGRQGDALAVYEETRRLLSSRLGVDPSPELAAVHLAILRGQAGAARPAGPTGDRPPVRRPAGPARPAAPVGPGWSRRPAPGQSGQMGQPGGFRRPPPWRRPPIPYHLKRRPTSAAGPISHLRPHQYLRPHQHRLRQRRALVRWPRGRPACPLR